MFQLASGLGGRTTLFQRLVLLAEVHVVSLQAVLLTG